MSLSNQFQNAPILQCDQHFIDNNFDNMAWLAYKVSYQLSNNSYYGLESMKLVAQDSTGTYSDVVTVEVGIMEMKCVNNGKCKGKFHYCFFISWYQLFCFVTLYHQTV